MRTATRQDYVVQAVRILARDGRTGLRIGSLCAAVGVTSGSFYHHFGGWDGFVATLLEHWHREETARIAELAAVPTDPVERMETLKHLVLTVPHEAEAALRAWAATDPVVADVQRRVDTERLRTLADVLAPMIPDVDLRDRLAGLGLSLLAGHQQIGPATGTDLATLLDQFQALVAAHARGVWSPPEPGPPWARPAAAPAAPAGPRARVGGSGAQSG